MIKKGTRYLALIAATFILAAVLLFAGRDDFGLGRNMEIAVNMMRELSLHYVDQVEPDKLMAGAAAGMVDDLDPYTEYMSEADMSNFELMTTGKYGGIGSLIRKKGDYITIAQPYKGTPADLAGLKIGDKIVAIDGKEAKGFSIEEVSKRLKGDPNTIVKLTVERLIGGARETFSLKRERIAIPGIPYAGFVADGIGYVQHSDFTEGCYEDMRARIEQLRAQGNLKGLILDYRNNGGGILQEAVKILSMFVPKGTEVVVTKGRKDSTVFRTAAEPILPNLPLVVLVNGNTASAAEIVSGALQDLDRAVLIGQKSFGKGLVQTTRPLGYNAFLKLTTAKYYMPSGRCIQAIDYSLHNPNGAVKEVPDSLIREFATKGGRKVYDGGGIMPDLKIEPEYISRFAMTLYALGFIEDFVDEYMKVHHAEPVDNKTFTITEKNYADFVAFMKDKKVPYESDTRRILTPLKAAAKSDRYKELEQYVEQIEKQLKDDTQTNLQTYRTEIIKTINNDIILRHNYSQGVIEHNLTDDPEVLRAVELLHTPEECVRILTSQDTVRK
ncbi:MAG: S41 family peptidase [Alistipes sp.]